MRILLLFFILMTDCWAGWSKIYNVAIDRTKCWSSNLTNFPVLIYASDASLKSTGNGGLVTNASGFDIVVATDQTIATYIPWEVEKWDSTNGVIWFWAVLGTVNGSSAGSNTTFSVAWGNSAITTQQNTGSFASTKVWAQPDNYIAVWHLKEATNPYADSTASGINSNAGTYPTQATGQIWDGQTFASLSSQYINFPGNDGGYGTSIQYTLSGWVNSATFAVHPNVILDTRGNSQSRGCVLYVDNATGYHAAWYCNNITQLEGSTNLDDGVWHYLVGTLGPGSTGTTALYVDGISVATGSASGFAGTFGGATNMPVGRSTDATPLYMNGTIDEVRLSACSNPGCNALHSADWITSEYNNQKLPGNIGSASFLIWTAVATTKSGFPIVQ